MNDDCTAQIAAELDALLGDSVDDVTFSRLVDAAVDRRTAAVRLALAV